MSEFLLSLHPILQAAFAGGFTWGITAAGAAVVTFGGSIGRRWLDAMLGFSGGVMLAASYLVAFGSGHRDCRKRATPSLVSSGDGILGGGGRAVGT